MRVPADALGYASANAEDLGVMKQCLGKPADSLASATVRHVSTSGRPRPLLPVTIAAEVANEAAKLAFGSASRASGIPI